MTRPGRGHPARTRERNKIMNGTPITIVGNIGHAPDLRFTTGGNPVASFSVAVAERRKNGDKWEDISTTWYRVNCWRGLAEHVTDSLTEGTRVIVHGTIAARHYEKDGDKRQSWEITADAVGPDLTWAVAQVKRMTRDAAPIPDEPWGSDSAPVAGNS
jgi:single-strand DNA-binding protein